MSAIVVWSLLFVLSAIDLASCEDVELEFFPPGPHKAGDTVKILCKAKAGEVFDFVNIVKDIDGKEYEMSTNDYMVQHFMNTGRYAMQWFVTDEFKEAGFSIRKVTGEDSGMIGCKHVLLDGKTFTAFEEFKVIVPPKSVELKHYSNGVEHTITDGQLILKEGEDGGIECVVVVDGSHDSPQVSILVDGQNAMDRFSKEENKTKNPNNGLVQMKTVITYEYLFGKPDLSLNGQTLVCTAQVDEFDPVSAQADIEVHYKPRIKCEASGAILGETVVLKCRGHMHPRLDLASVTWNRKPNSFTLTQSEPVHDRHEFNVQDNNNGTYVFTLTINGVEKQDFGNYKFEIQNSHDITEVKIKLQEVVTTTKTTTTTTTEPQPEYEVQTEPIPNSKPVTATEKTEVKPGAVARASVSRSLTLMSLVPLILCFLRS